MIDAQVRDHVGRRLDAVAAEHGVDILYAAESGSRAWGFPSPDSDYDCRFVYRHRREWYLSVEEARDVIECPLDDRAVDLSGWDLRKTLRLFLKSNPALHEWLASPFIYRADGAFAAALRDGAREHYCRATLARHYTHIAERQFRDYIAGQAAPRLKKYFYAVRPLLCALWLDRRPTLPPMALDALLEAADLPVAVRGAVDALVAHKRGVPELGTGPAIPVLDAWIAERLAGAAALCARLPERAPPLGFVDALYRHWGRL